MLSATKSQSATTAKRLEVEQGRFGKRGSRVRSSKFQWNCKLKVLISKLRVVNYKINLELQSSKRCAESNFEISSY